MELTANVQKIFDLIKDLNVVEINSLVKSLEEEFGVVAAASVVAIAGGASDEDVATKTDVNIELTDV